MSSEDEIFTEYTKSILEKFSAGYNKLDGRKIASMKIARGRRGGVYIFITFVDGTVKSMGIYDAVRYSLLDRLSKG